MSTKNLSLVLERMFLSLRRSVREQDKEMCSFAATHKQHRDPLIYSLSPKLKAKHWPLYRYRCGLLFHTYYNITQRILGFEIRYLAHILHRFCSRFFSRFSRGFYDSTIIRSKKTQSTANNNQFACTTQMVWLAGVGRRCALLKVNLALWNCSKHLINSQKTKHDALRRKQKCYPRIPHHKLCKNVGRVRCRKRAVSPAMLSPGWHKFMPLEHFDRWIFH